MTSYELSISAEYVPTWGVVEAIREFFQNALDEETRDPNNTMFYYYDFDTETFKIGNRHGKLDARSLLLGYTQKNSQSEMIGNHGEGYKLATVALLRLNKQITFYNYGCRQVWKPKFVKSRKYGGALVPTFFVETKKVWESIPDNDLVIEIQGITHDEYRAIQDNNLHMIEVYHKIPTQYGDILKDEKFKHRIFVSGLYICDDPDISFGVDFHPDVVQLERDRTMVNSFDLRWYISRIIEQSGDVELIESSLDSVAGEYIRYYNIPEIGDRMAKEFLEEHGSNAIPVSTQSDMHLCLSKNTVVVSRSMKQLLLDSKYYKSHFIPDYREDDSLSSRLFKFSQKIKSKLLESEIKELSAILEEVSRLEKISDYSEE